jgi:membrane-associated protein
MARNTRICGSLAHRNVAARKASSGGVARAGRRGVERRREAQAGVAGRQRGLGAGPGSGRGLRAGDPGGRPGRETRAGDPGGRPGRETRARQGRLARASRHKFAGWQNPGTGIGGCGWEHSFTGYALPVHLAVNLLSATSLIQAFGMAGVIAIIFAETGLLIGFFLPGDSLLFTAGVLTVPALAKGYHLSLPVLAIATPVAAILGAQLGHYIGAKAGPRLFSPQQQSRFFRQEYLHRAEHHFERYGEGKAVVLARFIPIIRTFLNPVAGALGMPARRFLLWNVTGGVIWTEAVLLVGHFLGQQLGKSFSIDKYILPVVAVIVILSLIPVALEIRKVRGQSRTGPGGGTSDGRRPARRPGSHRVGARLEDN